VYTAYLSATVRWFIVSAHGRHGSCSFSVSRRVPSSGNVSSPLLTTATTAAANATAIAVTPTVLDLATWERH